MSFESMFYPDGVIFTAKEKKGQARVSLIYDVTEDILLALEDLGLSKKDLATKLERTPALVSQLLSGSRNLTLNTLSDICFELGLKPSINIKSPSWVRSDQRWQPKQSSSVFKVQASTSKVLQFPDRQVA
jgi:transcriptional regulator with XRE-family HTH domain